MAWITRDVVADVTLHLREDGSPQKPPYISAGYRNSHIYFGDDEDKNIWGSFFPLVENTPLAGQTGSVRIVLGGPSEELDSELHPGACFSFFVGKRRIGTGQITAVLPD